MQRQAVALLQLVEQRQGVELHLEPTRRNSLARSPKRGERKETRGRAGPFSGRAFFASSRRKTTRNGQAPPRVVVIFLPPLVWGRNKKKERNALTPVGVFLL